MKNFNNLEELYRAIKNIVERKENKNDYFDLYLQETGDLELWVQTENFCDILLEDELTQKEYEQLAYKLYKHHVDVYVNRI